MIRPANANLTLCEVSQQRCNELSELESTASEGHRTKSFCNYRVNYPLAWFISCVWILLAACPSGAADRVSPEVEQWQQDRVATIAKASAAAISVFGPAGTGGGSGVVITADGYALSNFHVVKPSGDYMLCSMPDGNLYDAVVVGLDPTGDVALIKLLGRDDFTYAELGDSDQLRAGQWCFAVGNPFLLATDFQPTVTYGIISGVHRYQYPAGTLLEYTDCIQTDASINPGNSGGPLFNSQGQLVGINGRGSFEKRGRVNVGVAYAISINQIKNFMGYLRSGRIVDHATLGATVASDEDGRVVVVNILESSDVYRRGLRIDDELVAFGGRPITSANAFKNVLGIFPRGWRVPLSFRRDGHRFDVLARLTGVHPSEVLIQRIQERPRNPREPAPRPRKDRGPDDPPRRADSAAAGEESMPPHVAKFYQARRGYANYYFNRLNRDRVWNAFAIGGSFPDVSSPWRMIGELTNGGAVDMVLTDEEAVITLPTNQSRIDLSQGLESQLLPEGSGGFLLAMHLWRRLSLAGPDRYGDVYYFGTAPLPGRVELADVLVATHDVVETRFYFDPMNGHLLAMEMYPDTNVDPCEIFFHDYLEVEGRPMPHRLVVQFGDSRFAELQLQQISFSLASENGA